MRMTAKLGQQNGNSSPRKTPVGIARMEIGKGKIREEKGETRVKNKERRISAEIGYGDTLSYLPGPLDIELSTRKAGSGVEFSPKVYIFFIST